MKNEILFEEKQNQQQKWIWFLLSIVILVVTFALIQDYTTQKQMGNVEYGTWVYFLVYSLLFGLWFFLLKSKVHTKITKDAIFYKFSPVHKNFKEIKKEDIDQVYVRMYKPLKEYGGWGIRVSSNGKCYNMYGKIGIQLELKDGKKILIGTQKGKEAKKALEIFNNQ